MHVNLITIHTSPYEGFGRHARHLTRELLRLGVAVHPVTAEAADDLRRAGLALPGLNVQLVTQNRLLRLPGRNWAYTMYETTALPAAAVGQLNRWFERVLVPSTWCAEVFRASGVTVPIHVVPEGIDPDEFPLPPVVTDRTHAPFTFLALADRGRRKGYDLALAAFYQAFGSATDVRLILKTRKGGLSFLDGAASATSLMIWRADVTPVDRVYRRADCFLFPSHGEGWGLPPREAAALAVPTIVSAHSGLLDGIDGYATVRLNHGALVPSDMDGGGQWYRASVSEIADALRWVKANFADAKARAVENARWLRDHQTWELSARAFRAVLDAHGEPV